jgi:hypothetical protein
MKLEFITGYLSENQRNTGSLDIYYDFSGISGFFVPNRLYESQDQFNKVMGGFTVNSQYYPGIFVSCYQESGFTGSGIFEGTNTLKVLNQLSGDGISLFYNFGALTCNKNFNIGNKTVQVPTGKIQVLSYIESKSNTNPFEIILGLNDAYKLTLEFSGITGNVYENYKSTNLGELATQNVGGLRLNKKNIEFTYFDVIKNEISNQIINLSGYYFNQEKNIYIGNIPTGKYRSPYTGFIGNVDDFLGFHEYFDSNLSLGLSRMFIKTGEGQTTTNITGVKYNIIQSGFLNPTGILGTGITGYQMVPSQEIIDSKCGDTCIVYVKSGITGFITGEKIEYTIVSQEQYTTSQRVTKYNLYDPQYTPKFARNYIIFPKQIDNQDIIDIQLYKNIDNTLEFPSYSPLNKIYIADDIHDNKNLLLFFNGVNISSGNYTIIGNEGRFIINEYQKDDQDTISYTLAQFTDTKSDTFNYTTGEDIIIENPNNINFDLFLNGQKLISGLNYTSQRFVDQVIIKGVTGGIDENCLTGTYTRTSGGYNNFYNISGSTIYYDQSVISWFISGSGFLNRSYGSSENLNPLIEWIYDKNLNIITNGPTGYIRTGDHFVIDNNFPTGEIYVVQDDYFNRVTGSNLKLVILDQNYYNEKIWLNGIFQNRNYLSTSCINTLLQASGDIEDKTQDIFNNEYNRFI